MGQQNKRPLYGKLEAECLEVRETMYEDHIKYGLLLDHLGSCKRLVDIGAGWGQFLALATERVERRVARALLRLVGQAGTKTEGGVLIDFPLSRQDLAELTGTTLHTVSRILSSWEHKGIIESGRRRIVICQPHGLVTIAEDLAVEETDWQ